MELESITFNTPTIDVINNVDVAIENTPAAIKLALVKQLYSPVRWTETIEKLAQSGVVNLVETGPGKVIQGLVKRIDKSLACVAANSEATLTQAIELVK